MNYNLKNTFKAILSLLATLLFCFQLSSQVLVKGSGIRYYQGYTIATYPTATAPVTSVGTEFSYFIDLNIVCKWDRVNSRWVPVNNILVQSGVPAHTPNTGDPLTYLDKATGDLYKWGGASWSILAGGGALVVVSSISTVSDTSLLSPSTGDEFVLTTKDTSGIYSYDRWLLRFGGSAVSDGNKGDITVVGTTTWTINDDAVDAAAIAPNAVGASELVNTSVTPGSYTNINATIDEDGRITAASSGNSGGGQGLTVLDTTFTSNYVASTDSVINILTSVTESNDIVVSLPEPSKSTVAVTYTVNQVDRNNDDLGFTLVQVDGVGYDFYNNGDTLQFVSFTPDVSESYKIETIYLDGAYRWNTTKISSENVFFSGTVAPVDTNKLWLDGSEDGIPKLWNPITQQYDPLKFDYEVDSVGEILGKKFPIPARVLSKGLDGKGEARYFIQPDTIPGLIVDSLGQIPVSGGNFAVLDGLLNNIPTINFQKLGVKKGANYSDLIEKYISAFDKVEVIIPNDTLELLDIYIADNSSVSINFDNTVVLMPRGVTVDIKDDSMHVFNFKNVDNINITGVAEFNHADTSNFTLIIPPKWDGTFYQANQIFHIDAGADYESHSQVNIKGDYRKAFKLVDSWYNFGKLNTQVPEFSFTKRSYDLVHVENVGVEYATACFSSRGNLGKLEFHNLDIVTDVYKNLWTTEGLGRNGSSQEASADNDMKMEVKNVYIKYGGMFFQNIQDLVLEDVTIENKGFWRDRVNNVDSVVWSEGVFDSTTSEALNLQVRAAGGPGIKIDHALYRAGQEPRTANVSRVRFRGTIREDQYTGEADATNLQFEGDDLDSRITQSYFDDELVYGGSPGDARAPIITESVFGPNGQVIATDGFIMDNCVFRDSLERNGNPNYVDMVDTVGTWGGGLTWSPTGGGGNYPIIVTNTNFYSRKVTIQNNRKGYKFVNCGFFDYTELTIGDGTLRPDSIEYNLSLDNCYGGKIRSPFALGVLSDSANINIRNHRDLLITDANWQSLIDCNSCDINNVDVLDYANDIPHDRTAYRADLSAQSLVKDYLNFQDSLKLDKGLMIDMSHEGKSVLGEAALAIDYPSATVDTVFKVRNSAGNFPFVLLADGKFMSSTTSARSQIWGSSWAVTTLGGGITTLNLTAADVRAQYSQLKIADSGYTFFSDTNTGMYRIGSDNLGFRTNNILGLEITSTQGLLGDGRLFTVDNPKGGTNTIQASIDSLALTYSLFPAITYTPTDSMPVDTTLQSFPITGRLNGDTLRQITYTVTKAPTVNLNLRVLIWDGSSYTAAFSGTIPAGQRSVTVSGAVAVATDERIFPEILTDSGASGLDLELKFQKP